MATSMGSSAGAGDLSAGVGGASPADASDYGRGSYYDDWGQEEHTTETRRSTSTSEFYVFLVLSVVLVFFGYESGRDSFARDDAWRYVTWLGAAYLVSRGLAKAGVYEAYMRDRNDRR
jgi:hypothetical protein